MASLRSLGDLDLHSAWLYFGSLAAASENFGVSIHTYRKALRQPSRRSLWKSRKLSAMSDTELDLILDGSAMIMEMRSLERRALFPTHSRPTITKTNYIRKVESWRNTQAEQRMAGDGFSRLPVGTSKDLVEAYVSGQNWLLKAYCKDREDWQLKILVRTLFEVRLNRQLHNAIEIKESIRHVAEDATICAVALNIISEYETYCSQKAEILKHINTQRKVVDSKREKLLAALKARDGGSCRQCESPTNLRIDHIRALSIGGFSVLENLQLLCGFCNTRKSGRSMDYLNRRKQRRGMSFAIQVVEE